MRHPLPLLAIALLLILTAVLPTAAQSQAKYVTVLKTDSSLVQGQLVSLNDARVVVNTKAGQITVQLDEVNELLFSRPATAQERSAETATPTKANESSVDSETFGRALRVFHRMVNATEVGITYIDYRREILDAKTAFDEAMATFPEGTQRTLLSEAMNDYIIAADVWQTGIQFDGVPTKTDFYRDLNKRYALGVNPRLGLKVQYNPLLRIIWATASERLQRAVSQQK